MIRAPPLFPVNRGSGQSRLDIAPDTPGTLRNELVQQRKRHNKPRHRQPESAASGTMASLHGCHYHGRSTSSPSTSESSETPSVIGYIHNIGSNWIFTWGTFSGPGGLAQPASRTFQWS